MGKAIRSQEAIERRRIAALRKLADWLKAVKKPGSLQEKEWEALIWAIPIVEAKLSKESSS